MENPTNKRKKVLFGKRKNKAWLAEKLGKSFTIVNPYVCNHRLPSFG